MSKINKSKDVIEYLHGNLKDNFGLSDELINLLHLDQHLPPQMQEAFLNNPIHGNLLTPLLQLNEQFIPVLEQLVCYKSDMGLLLQRMVESYNLLILMQFTGFYNIENAKVKEYTQKNKVLDQKIEETQKQRDIYDGRQTMINTLLASKDVHIKQCEGRVEELEKKIDELHQYIKDQKMDLSVSQVALNQREKLQKEIEMMDESSDSIGSDSDDLNLTLQRANDY